jgi:hypothetical protein
VDAEKEEHIRQLTAMVRTFERLSLNREQEIENLRKTLMLQEDESLRRHKQLLTRLDEKEYALIEKDAKIRHMDEEFGRLNTPAYVQEARAIPIYDDSRFHHESKPKENTKATEECNPASDDVDQPISAHDNSQAYEQQMMYPQYDERGNSRVTESPISNKRRTVSMPLTLGESNANTDEELPKQTSHSKGGSQYPKYNVDATAYIPRTPVTGSPQSARATSMPLYVPFANFENHNWVIESLELPFDDNATASTASAEEMAILNAKTAEETILKPFLGLDMIVPTSTETITTTYTPLSPPSRQNSDDDESYCPGSCDASSESDEDVANYDYGSYSSKGSDAKSKSDCSVGSATVDEKSSDGVDEVTGTRVDDTDDASESGSSVGPDDWVCPEVVVDELPPPPKVNRLTGDAYVLELIRSGGVLPSDLTATEKLSRYSPVEDVDAESRSERSVGSVVADEEEAVFTNDDVDKATGTRVDDTDDASESGSSVGPDDWVCPEVVVDELPPPPKVNRLTGDAYVLELIRSGGVLPSDLTTTAKVSSESPVEEVDAECRSERSAVADEEDVSKNDDVDNAAGTRLDVTDDASESGLSVGPDGWMCPADDSRASGEDMSSDQSYSRQTHSDESISSSGSSQFSRSYVKQNDSYSSRSLFEDSESEAEEEVVLQAYALQYSSTAVPYKMDMIDGGSRKGNHVGEVATESLQKPVVSETQDGVTRVAPSRRHPGEGRRARSGSLAFGGTMLNVAKGAGEAAYGAAKATVGVGVDAAKFTTKGAVKALSATTEASVEAAKYTARSSVKAISATTRGAASVLHAGAASLGGNFQDSDMYDETDPSLGRSPGQSRRARSGSLAFGGSMIDVAKGAGGAAMKVATAAGGAAKAAAGVGVDAAKYTANNSVKAISVTAGAGVDVAKLSAGGAAKAISATTRGAVSVSHAGAFAFGGDSREYECPGYQGDTSTPVQRPPGEGYRVRSGSLAFGGTMLDVAKGTGEAAFGAAKAAVVSPSPTHSGTSG